MYSKEKLIELINNDGQYIDAFMLDAFIKNWKLEAIYEDENGIEFFDDESLEKIKSNLAPKNDFSNIVIEEVQPKEEIQEEKQTIDEPTVQPELQEIQPENKQINTESPVIEQAPIVTENTFVETNKNYVENEIKNVTLDITNQTLGVLAESIASKITTDIAQHLKNTDFLEEAMNMGAFRKDNEILAKKIQEIINDNKVLVKKIQELENQSDNYIKVFGNIYVKKNTK